LAVVLSGARVAGSGEQAAFGALSSFAATIVTARTVNYARERRRETPARRRSRCGSAGVARNPGRAVSVLSGVPSPRPDTRQQRRRTRDSAVSFVEAHFAQPLSLDDVARHTMTSTRQLQRILREEGTSFRALVLRVRMAHAVALLCTDMPIREVAAAVGYPDAASFARAFRSHLGCSPSTWRSRPRPGSAGSSPSLALVAA
jgi:AraC-like DNA-binding protein